MNWGSRYRGFIGREGVSVGAFQYHRQRKFEGDRSLVDESLTASAPRGLFAPVEVVSRQAVTIRFAGGAVMEMTSLDFLYQGI